MTKKIFVQKAIEMGVRDQFAQLIADYIDSKINTLESVIEKPEISQYEVVAKIYHNQEIEKKDKEIAKLKERNSKLEALLMVIHNEAAKANNLQ